MFEAKIADAANFRKLIEAIKDLVKNANIDVSPTGMSIQAMDSSHVALVSLNMKQNGFESYRCDKSMTLGLSIENVSKILKCAGNDDYITLHCEDEPSSLGFNFESKNGEKISEFSLTLMHMDTEQLGIPDDAFTSECTMPASEFARICKEFGGIGDSIRVETTKENIKFSVTGEIGNGSTLLRAKDTGKEETTVRLDVEDPVNLSFSTRYLNLFSKASTVASQVVLSMSADRPLLLEYKLPKGLGELKFYLAPKITDEE